MRKGVLPHDRLVALHCDAGDMAHQAAGGVEPTGLDPGVELVVVMARAQRHHHLLQGAVAGTLAQTVDGALDLPGTLPHGG